MLPRDLEGIVQSYLKIPQFVKDIESSIVMRNGSAMMYFIQGRSFWAARVFDGELVFSDGYMTRPDFFTTWSIHNGDWADL